MSDLKMTTGSSTDAATSETSSSAAGASSGASLEGQLLVLVLDLNPNQPLFARQPSNLVHWLDSALALLNSHLMLRTTNSVACVAASAQGCSFLYPSPADDEEEGDGGPKSKRARPSVTAAPDGQFEGFHKVESAVREGVKRILRRETEPGAPVVTDSLLSGALCMALAHVNRARTERERDEPGSPRTAARVLVMSASGDTAAQYMTYMNAFFSAQKMQVRIDACMVDRDSGLLQQGADITGGQYRLVGPRHFPSSLLQILLWIFLPGAGGEGDGDLRSALSLPAPERVDYRAACFCHRRLVDVGFVCSVCLSVFCKFAPICSTCETVFKAPVPMLPAAAVRRSKKAVGGAANAGKK